MNDIAPIAVVIDTDKYVGNFERQLCAYVTGILGECEVGEEEAAQALEDFGGVSPFENLMAQEMDESGCFHPVTIWPTPGLWRDGMGNIVPETHSPRHPAYNSVALLFDTMPKPALMQTIRDRAARFCQRKGVTITGYRLVTRTVVMAEMPLPEGEHHG